MEQATNYFLAFPMNKDLAKFHMTDAEWEALKHFEMILTVCIYQL